MSEQTEKQNPVCSSGSRQEPVVMPLQPIKDGRFIPNRIVEKLLEVAPIDLNDIAGMDFTNEERMQLAQLIGYSVGGFTDLSYVNDETYEVVALAMTGISEQEARNTALRGQMEDARKGVKQAAVALFTIHPDDLEA